MKKIYLSFILLLALYSISCAGEWSLQDKHTLRLDGPIEKSDIARFNELMSKDIKTLIVNCGGGDVLAAIPIAVKMQRRKINILVDGICASSCANYLFIAAQNKRVPEGSLVLFHGGITPMLVPKDQISEAMIQAGAGTEEIKSHLSAWHKGAQNERELYDKAGVEMALLEYSSRATNGKYDFWAPPPATLKKLGVNNIILFWYPGSDEELNILTEKLRLEYAEKFTTHSSRLNIMGGDIYQYSPEEYSNP